MTDEAIRARLQTRAASGKASRDELRMLKAACRNLGDAACTSIAQRGLDQLNKPK